ncbi:PH domain-containing protein [Salipaludibacillus aurantiacus]|uniref:Putative membrane protein n=1 Tax=Salipaludibacillus aurantiacus TaxID=1601833 RepID=A0A1H9P337_9BACI|nr:PH domain-containing protein [Salipaludibacillus aurantiacus]SER42588.1 putative membrane protein [Salipaludibacillus aurantiacus]
MNDWKRQHPASIFISFLSNLKQMIITLIAVFIFGQSAQAANPIFYFIFFTGILLFSVLNGFVSWWKFYYNLQFDELQIKQGLIFKKNRFIRKDRIQSIDINAKLVQRLFGLVEVKIETAGGGGEPEFRIVALKREEALKIKSKLLNKHPASATSHDLNTSENEGPAEETTEEETFQEGGVTKDSEAAAVHLAEDELDDHLEETIEETEPDEQWELGSRRLVIAALTSSGVGIAATFIAAVVSQAPQFLPEWLLDQVIGWFIHSSLLLIGSLLVIILFIAWLFTLTSTILKYGFFKIKKNGVDIHISRGVLEQRQLTLNSSRITAVRIVQSPIRQPFRYVSVYVESTGGGTKEEDLSTVLIPLCKREEVEELLGKFVPEFAFTPVYEGLPKESLRRYMIKLIAPAVALSAAATYFLPYGWFSVALPLIAAFIGYIQYRAAGITAYEDFLCIRSRALSKTEVILPKRRIQDFESSQNVLQKMDDLYTVHVSVLTSLMGKTFSLRHVSGRQIEDRYAWYSYGTPEDGNK